MAPLLSAARLALALALPAVCSGFISSIEPTKGSLAGGTIITIHGGGLISNDTSMIDMYIGQLPCDVQWYRSNNQRVYCQTRQLHHWGVDSPGYRFIYYNLLTASIVTCDRCHFQYNADNTPYIEHWRKTVASSAVFSLSGTFHAKFAEQYTINVGGLRCTGARKVGTPLLQFGLDLYEQVVAEDWDERTTIQCYLPALEAGWKNISVHVAHQTKSVIQSPGDTHTLPFRGRNEGLGNAQAFSKISREYDQPSEDLVTVHGGSSISQVLVVPQLQSLSTSASGLLGRQTLEIQGSGFAPRSEEHGCSSNVVRLAGVRCPVTECNSSRLLCTVAPRDSTGFEGAGPFQSGFGLVRTMHSSDSFSASSITSQETFTSGGLLATTSARADQIRGVFIAPQTAWYSFQVTGRRRCSLSVHADADDSSAELTSATCRNSPSDDRYYDYIAPNYLSGSGAMSMSTAGQQTTERVFLLAGSRHAIRARHWGASGSKTFKASVRIHSPPQEPTETEVHYYAVPERQAIRIHLATQPEVWTVSFSNVGGDSQLYFRRSVYGDDLVWNATCGCNSTVRVRRPRSSRTISIDDRAGLQSLLRSDYASGHGCNEITVAKEGDAALYGTVTYTVTTSCVPRLHSNAMGSYADTMQLDLLTRNYSYSNFSWSDLSTTAPHSTGQPEPVTTVLSVTSSVTSSDDSGSGSGIDDDDTDESGSGSASMSETSTSTTSTETTTTTVSTSTGTTTTTTVSSTTSTTVTTQTDLPDVSVRWVEQQKATIRVGGYFRVSFDGVDWAVINRRASSSAVRDALRRLAGVTDVKVRKYGQFDRRRNSYPDVIGVYDLEFMVPQGRDYPQLVVDQSNLSPYPAQQRGTVTVSVATLQNGTSGDLLYDPIPDHMFEVPVSTSQATVEVNDIRAQCASSRLFVNQWWDEYYDDYSDARRARQRRQAYGATQYDDCSFVYDDYVTPIVLDTVTGQPNNTAAAGENITITGTGFMPLSSSVVQVRFGGAPCAVVAHSATTISCTLAAMKSGLYHPVVIVSGVGQARVSESASKLRYPLRVRSVTPSQLGVRGGSLISISGTGFSNIGPENQVSVGALPCSVQTAAFGEITCFAPPGPIEDLDSLCWGGLRCNSTADENTTSGGDNNNYQVTPGAFTSPNSEVQLAWSAGSSPGTVQFTLIGSAVGYVAIGFTDIAGSMGPADVAMCRASGGQVILEDRFNVNTGTNVLDSDGLNDLTLVSSSVSSTEIACTFTRPIEATSSHDRAIPVGPANIIWATSASSSAAYHGNSRGYASVAVLTSTRRIRRQTDDDDSVTVSSEVQLRVFDYQPTQITGDAWGNWIGGVFDGYGTSTEDFVSERLDGGWGGWRTEVEQVLRDTKYYGYTCDRCDNQLQIPHSRWGSLVDGQYVREASLSTSRDGAWGGWVDGAWSGWSDSGVDAADMADGSWGQWHNGTWGPWASADETVTYNWELTPTIASITPWQISSARTTRITIGGDFFEFTSLLSHSSNCTPSMRFVSPSGLFRECQDLVVNDTQASCILVRGKPFPAEEQQKIFPRLALCTADGLEVTAHPEPDCCSPAPFLGRVDVALRIDSTTPTGGSLAGGTVVTIRGAGFGPLDGRIVRSALTYNYFDEMTVVNITTDHKTLSCSVQSSNFTTITCVTPMLNAESDVTIHPLEFAGAYIYNGPQGRNGRLSVSVNDILATGCSSDPDAWDQPTPSEPNISSTLEHFFRDNLSTTCAEVLTNGGRDVLDYRFTFFPGTHDFASGLVVSVTASRNVHLVLAPTNESVGAERNHEMYEIVLGMAMNTQSAIRRTKFGAAEISVDTEYILDPSGAPTQFWVKYDQGSGVLEVGRGCTVGRGTFMQWADSTPLNVEHFGVATDGVNGEFRYCTDSMDAEMPEGPCAPTTTSGPTVEPSTPLYVLQYQDSASQFLCEFDYREDRTPIITSVEPTSVSGPTMVTVTGTNFLSQPAVHVGPHPCAVSFWNSTSFVCDLDVMAAGRYYLKVRVPQLGFAAHPTDPESAYMIASELGLSSISPATGGVEGGVTVTITGYGFATNASGNEVLVDSQPAHILNSNHTQLIFVVPKQGNVSGLGDIVVAVQTDRVATDSQYGQVTPAARRYAANLNTSELVHSAMGEYFRANNEAEYDNITSTWITPGTLYAQSADCPGGASTCRFLYNVNLTPSITGITPESGYAGTLLTIEGAGLAAGDSSPTVDVLIGNVPCAIQSISDSAVVCALGATPAGLFRVWLTNHAVGMASGNVTFESMLEVTSVVAAHGSYGGGQVLTISGRGFSGGLTRRRDRRDGAWGGWIIYEYRSTEARQALLGTAVRICGAECVVTSTAYTELTCTTSRSYSPEYFASFGAIEAEPLSGSIVSSGAPEAISHGSAFDGDYETFFESEGACFTGLDLGEGNAAVISKVRWFPAHQRPELMVGGAFQLSTDGATWTTVHSVVDSTEGWNFALIENYTVPVRFARFFSPAQHCAIAMLEFVGVRASASGTCPIEVLTQEPLSHPAFGPANTDFAIVHKELTSTYFTYSVADTPTVTSISPRYGSSLGGTLVTISGVGLPTSVQTAEVQLNSRPCAVQTASASEITCITTPRGIFMPLSVRVREVGGAGFAVLNESVVHFRYLDRWSELTTWLNDEPPAEGDTVVIPSDQAVLIDVPLPRLFLFLIQGFVVVDPDATVPLNINATYIIVYGGALQVGTAAEPFTGQLAITLHGHRYETIELPTFGSKVLAVADRGGLSRSAFANGAGHEVPLSQRGILDIHGESRQTVWTHLATTANAGASSIRTTEPVDWRSGEKLIITGEMSRINPGETNDLMADMPPPCMPDLFPPPSSTTAEEVIVDRVSDDGHTVWLTQPLQHRHQSEVRSTPDGAVIEMRAQVALLSRNVIVQGDDSSAEQLFGAHTIAVHGGHLRVENAEVRNCGQARNLGRYCLHFHKAGYQPPTQSYLKSNSIHNSFQRATTIHGTTHALVQNNVAYKVMGHNFFVEDGDEEYTVLDHNIGIETIISPYSLFSDCQAATFWTASPKQIWRNNVAANSHGHGFWFELDAGAAGDFTSAATIEVDGNTFHDNNLRGWFIAPKYTPSTPQYFRNNTYFRNQLDGVFYGVGGDTHHIGDKFASNSGTADLLWWFFPSRESSRWIPNLKDVVFAGGDWGLQGRPTVSLFAPNQEFFLVDGAEFVNFTVNGQSTSAITQCFDCCGYRSRQGAYTTRFNRLSFSAAEVRTSYACPQKQIFFDLDGSLTGQGPATTVTAYHAFNEWEECPRQNETFSNGLVCNSSVRVRKLSIPSFAAPKRTQPRELNAKDMYIKKSRKVEPHGFKAVFEYTGPYERPTRFERIQALRDIAQFLGQQVDDVQEDFDESSTSQLGVIVGGFLPVNTSIYALPAGTVPMATAAHRGLCIDGELTEYHESNNITRTFNFTGIAVGKFTPVPISCSAPSQLAHECKYSAAYLNGRVSTLLNVSVNNSGVPSGFYSLGTQTRCSAVDEYNATGFPVRFRNSPGLCAKYESIADVYDPIDYSSWLKFGTEDSGTATTCRRPGASANSVCYGPLFPVWDGVPCAEWTCASSDVVPCSTWQCIRAADYRTTYSLTNRSTPGWHFTGTWLRGLNAERDGDCTLFTCHQSDAASDTCTEFRCANALNPTLCVENFPVAATESDCAAACAINSLCTAAKFWERPIRSDLDSCQLFNIPPALLIGAEVADGNPAERCLGKMTEAMLAAASGTAPAASDRTSLNTCKPKVRRIDEFGGIAWSQFESTGRMQSDPSVWRQNGVRCSGENGVCSCDGYVRYGRGSTWTAGRLVTGTINCNNQVFGDPLVGVSKECRCSTRAFDAEDGLGGIEFGPGRFRTRNSPPGFDWEGWAVPLVTHHDYVVDWDWHIDFQQFSMRWSEPFLLQNPTVAPSSYVPTDARFAGPQDFAPLTDGSVLLSFAYVDYRYRFRVEVPRFPTMPWYDKLSDNCIGNQCATAARELGPLRGEITRHDAFGTTFVDRRDDSLVTSGYGGTFNVAINPWSGVNTTHPPLAIDERPTPLNTSLTVKALQCSPYMCNSGLQLPLRESIRWTDPDLWQELTLTTLADAEASQHQTGSMPQANAVVEIPAGWHVVFDRNYFANETLEKIVVHGKLSFDDTADRSLHVRSIVNFGTIEVGTASSPFSHHAEIVLHGNRTSNTVVVSDQHYLGNKMIANFGNLTLVAQAPTVIHTKLATTAHPGDYTVTLLNPVSWMPGDHVVLTGTDYHTATSPTQTGSYTGYRFVVLPSPAELSTTTEDLVVAAVENSGRTIRFTTPLRHRHFAGAIDTGIDYENLAVHVAGQHAPILFSPRAVSQAGINIANRSNTQWSDLVGASIAYVDTSAVAICDESSAVAGWPTMGPNATIALIDMAQVTTSPGGGCSYAALSRVAHLNGAAGLIIRDTASVISLYDNTARIPTMIIGGSAGQSLLTNGQANLAMQLHPHGTPVELRATLGNLQRRIVVRGEVQRACTAAEHSAIHAHYVQRCAENQATFFDCMSQHGMPASCYWLKGYGAHIFTGEWNYGSEDDFRRTGDLNRTRTGQVFVSGVEFRDLGKLASEHRGFVINYFNDYQNTRINNTIDKCVFRHSWLDAIVLGRAPAARITDNIVHRTLGLGITTGDPLLNVGYSGLPVDGSYRGSGRRDRRADAASSMIHSRRRRTMSVSLNDFARIPSGGGHTIDRNLVTAAFEYPYAQVSSFRHYMWHAGMLLRQPMDSMKGNIVAGAAHGGMSFMTQSLHDQQGPHRIEDNEAYGCRYGAIPRNTGRAAGELYRFAAWSNAEAGIVAFDESTNFQLREVVLSDNKYGAVVSFHAHADFTVRNSSVIGQSAVSAHLASQCHVRAGLALPIYTPNPGPRCQGTMFGPCKECSVDWSAMSERFGNAATGRFEHFYIESTRFAHFGECASRGIHLADTSPDYSPDVWLTRLQWHATVDRAHRIRLGDTAFTHSGCNVVAQRPGQRGAGCDAVMYLKAHDTDGSTLGDFWRDGRDNNYANTVMHSDTNPAITSEANCRADPWTRSIVCENFPQTTISVDVPPQCNDGCEPVSHITIHKYGATSNRSFFSVGAFEQGCSCQKHFIGSSFPALAGSMYDVDLPVVNDLNLGNSADPNAPSTLYPQFVPPNTRFTVHSGDPNECILVRLYMQLAAPVTLIMQDNFNMNEYRLDDGNLPTVTSPRGTNALDPQQRRFYATLCGGFSNTGGAVSYTLRVEERVQVSLTVDMSFEEFFVEAVPPQPTIQETVELFQRTTGLEQLVNNMATLLEIDLDRIRVACVHAAGEPCIPLELMLATGGSAPGGGRRERRSVSDPSVIEFQVTPPNAVNETGNQTVYQENVDFLSNVSQVLQNSTSDDSWVASLEQALSSSIGESNRSSALGGVNVTINEAALQIQQSFGNDAGQNSSFNQLIMSPIAPDTTTTTTDTTHSVTSNAGDFSAGAANSEGSDDDTIVAVAVVVPLVVIIAVVVTILVKRSQRNNEKRRLSVPFGTAALSRVDTTWTTQRNSGIDASEVAPLRPKKTLEKAPSVQQDRGSAVVVRDSLIEADFKALFNESSVDVKSPSHTTASLNESSRAADGNAQAPQQYSTLRLPTDTPGEEQFAIVNGTLSRRGSSRRSFVEGTAADTMETIELKEPLGFERRSSVV